MKILPWAIVLATGGIVLTGFLLKERLLPLPPPEETTLAGDRFTVAQQLAWEAAVLVQRPPHPTETWQQARVKWRQAIRLLEAIPASDSRSTQVREKLTLYRQNYTEISDRLTTEESAVANLKAAKDLAWQAAVAVQNPPHSLRVWQRAEDKWQAAIAQLEMISPKTLVFQQSEEKLATYRANHREISQRVALETTAQALWQHLLEIDQRLSALANRVFGSDTLESLGISYEEYDRQVQNLETALNEFEQQGGKDHPLLPEVRSTIADYRFASNLWKSYRDFKQSNSEWLKGDEPFNQLVSLSISDRDQLLERYQLEPFSSGKKVSLKFTVWQIWSHAHEQVSRLQAKFHQPS